MRLGGENRRQHSQQTPDILYIPRVCILCSAILTLSCCFVGWTLSLTWQDIWVTLTMIASRTHLSCNPVTQSHVLYVVTNYQWGIHENCQHTLTLTVNIKETWLFWTHWNRNPEMCLCSTVMLCCCSHLTSIEDDLQSDNDPPTVGWKRWSILAT